MKNPFVFILFIAILAQMVFAANNSSSEDTLTVDGNKTISMCEVTIGRDFHESYWAVGCPRQQEIIL